MDYRPTDEQLQAIDVASCVIDDSTNGKFDVMARAFADPAVFEMELQKIFYSTWVYLAHESQIPNPHDFFATQIGRQPVVLTRGPEGDIHCFLNTCSHRGAKLTMTQRGNRKNFMCPFHGWVYDHTGRCVDVNNQAKGGYSAHFEQQSHDLRKPARFGNYRGFLFASLNPDVEDLETHLGGSRTIIDMFADQSEQGLEILPGGIKYTCDANWKIQLENIDGYHFFPVHVNYIQLIQRRMQKESGNQVKTIDPSRMSELPGGSYEFENGHGMDWGFMPNGDDRPLGFQRDKMESRFGKDRSRWMIDHVRNLVVYPNVLFMDQSSSTVRIIHPIAVDKTLIEVYCIAPKGEPKAARERRVRQFEDFLGPAGLATPDDQAVMEQCQRGLQANQIQGLQAYYRGISRVTEGADEEARKVGIAPLKSNNDIDDETFVHSQYREWLRLMTA